MGWATTSCKYSRSEGVGDDKHSFAFDGYRVLKWHKRKFSPFGEKCRVGDVVGCGLDVENRKALFWVNGRPLGVAFDRVKVRDGLYAGLSTEAQERLRFNLGGSPFTYPPPYRAASYFENVNTEGTEDGPNDYVFKNWSPLHMTVIDIHSEACCASCTDILSVRNPFLNLNEEERRLFASIDSTEDWTALHLAAFLGRDKLVDELIELHQKGNVSIDVPDALQRTPLIVAALGRADAQVIGNLIRAGASLTAEDRYGRNALHYCAVNGNIAATQKILEVSSPESST